MSSMFTRDKVTMRVRGTVRNGRIVWTAWPAEVAKRLGVKVGAAPKGARRRGRKGK